MTATINRAKINNHASFIRAQSCGVGEQSHRSSTRHDIIGFENTFDDAHSVMQRSLHFIQRIPEITTAKSEVVFKLHRIKDEEVYIEKTHSFAPRSKIEPALWLQERTGIESPQHMDNLKD